MIPFMGGVFAMIAFCLMPVGNFSERLDWAWLPLIADPSVAILPTFPFAMLWYAHKERRDRSRTAGITQSEDQGG